MKSELLPECDILELLAREIAPEQEQRWHRTDDRLRWMLWRDNVNRLLVAGLGLSSWYVGWEDGVRGSGDTIPAAVADFRRQVLADAVAVGAVPNVNPTSGYNYLEAAIFAAFFQYAYTNSHTPSEAIDAAMNAVEEYRAALK